eukprot:TRINITY_DN92862_c0_g1_i1.p1 TRINITY_DN92862_c0_g1~~TRINITY_DN92862_c0_g1_i1.p1  ORF type:complete len:188 (-),score=28.35 TRINITY_DN92862_c0_g1_i1:258-821(-)
MRYSSSEEALPKVLVIQGEEELVFRGGLPGDTRRGKSCGDEDTALLFGDENNCIQAGGIAVRQSAALAPSAMTAAESARRMAKPVRAPPRPTICMFFLAGCCQAGESCTAAHSLSDTPRKCPVVRRHYTKARVYRKSVSDPGCAADCLGLGTIYSEDFLAPLEELSGESPGSKGGADCCSESSASHL